MPIVVTLFGIFIDVSAEHALKVRYSIVVRPFGIFIDVNAEHHQKPHVQ